MLGEQQATYNIQTQCDSDQSAVSVICQPQPCQKFSWKYIL